MWGSAYKQSVVVVVVVGKGIDTRNTIKLTMAGQSGGTSKPDGHCNKHYF